jgi:2-methylcitrate dehydratase PrpD
VEATAQALGLGATFVLVPSYNNAVAGATTLNLAGGMSGFAGALVPELALAGFSAREDGLEEAFSLLVANGFEEAPVVDELGERWEITRNAFRLRACCIPTYASLDALEAALAELRAQPGDIARIDVETYEFAAAMRSQQPANSFAARYSLPHAAAAIVLRGDVGLDAFAEALVRDPAYARMRERVHVTADAEMTARYPRDKAGRVTVTLSDGRTATDARDGARGDFRQPYAEAEIRGKFRGLAERLLPARTVGLVEQAVDSIESWSSPDTLLDILRSARAE